MGDICLSFFILQQKKYSSYLSEFFLLQQGNILQIVNVAVSHKKELIGCP